MIRLRVKEVAHEKGISQSRLSRKADVDLTTLRKIYREPTKANPTVETIGRLATALGVHPGELIEQVDDEE